jgi:hypothetical protein
MMFCKSEKANTSYRDADRERNSRHLQKDEQNLLIA